MSHVVVPIRSWVQVFKKELKEEKIQKAERKEKKEEVQEPEGLEKIFKAKVFEEKFLGKSFGEKVSGKKFLGKSFLAKVLGEKFLSTSLKKIFWRFSCWEKGIAILSPVSRPLRLICRFERRLLKGLWKGF